VQSNSKKLTSFLLAAEGIGVLFVIIYSAAYMLGLPTTKVYHSEPVFRTTLSILGIILIAIAIVALIAAAVWKRKE